MRYLKILIAVVLLASCEEYFQPNVDVSETAYVFDGMITDQPGPYRVRITRSTGYNNNSIEDVVTDAKVIIECNDGKTYKMTIDNDGNYLSDSSMFVGEPGKTYRLYATNVDGKTFTSSWEMLLPCPEIEQVSGLYYETKKIVKNGTNYYDEIDMGICATNTTDAAGFTPYYRYECKVVLQTRQHYPGSVPIERYVYRPLDLKDNLFLADAGNYGNNKIVANQLYKTTDAAMKGGIGGLVLGMEEFEVYDRGEFIRVTQYSLTEKQYKFWKAVKDQQENTKYFFGKLENQPIGNMTCDSGDKAFGYFCASAVKQNICALSLKEKQKVVVRYDIDYFPDTDTVAVYEQTQDFTIPFEN